MAHVDRIILGIAFLLFLSPISVLVTDGFGLHFIINLVFYFICSPLSFIHGLIILIYYGMNKDTTVSIGIEIKKYEIPQFIINKLITFLEILLFSAILFGLNAGFFYSEEVLLLHQLSVFRVHFNLISFIRIFSSIGACIFTILSAIFCDLYVPMHLNFPIIIIGTISFAISLLIRNLLFAPFWMVIPNVLLIFIGKLAYGAVTGAFISYIPKLFKVSNMGSIAGLSVFFYYFGELSVFIFMKMFPNYYTSGFSQFLTTSFASAIVIATSIPLLLFKLIRSVSIHSYSEIKVDEYESNERANEDQSEIDDYVKDENATLTLQSRSNFNFIILLIVFILTIAGFAFSLLSQEVLLIWIESHVQYKEINAFYIHIVVVLIFTLLSSLIYGLIGDLLHGKLILAIIANIVLLITNSINALTLNFYLLIITGFFKGVAFGVFNSSVINLIMQYVPTKRFAGTVLSIASVIIIGARIFSSIIGILLIGKDTVSTVFKILIEIFSFIVVNILFVAGIIVIIVFKPNEEVKTDITKAKNYEDM